MPGLGLAGGFGQGAGVESARYLMERRFREALAQQEMQQRQQQIDETQRQFNVMQPLRERGVAVDEGNLGLRGAEFDAERDAARQKVVDLNSFLASLPPDQQMAARAKGQFGINLKELQPAQPGTSWQSIMLNGKRVRVLKNDVTGDTIRVEEEQPERAPMPVLAYDPSGQAGLVNRGTGTWNPVTMGGAGGGPLGQAPTTEQRNRTANTGRASVVLDSIDELSQKINTGYGAMAKISGFAERQAAKANLDDDVAEYEAVVSGFVPILARAVGHTGVLTEPDVQSVRKMLPQVGDSKSVRDRKMARIRKIWEGMNPQAGGGGNTPSGADSTRVRVTRDAQGNLVVR